MDDAVTFFKDAKDNETYEVSEQWTEMYLFDAVMAYSNLAPDRCGSALMSTFVVRFGVERQDLFVTDAFSLLERKISKSFNLKRLERLSKMEFLKEFLGFLGAPSRLGLAEIADSEQNCRRRAVKVAFLRRRNAGVRPASLVVQRLTASADNLTMAAYRASGRSGR